MNKDTENNRINLDDRKTNFIEKSKIVHNHKYNYDKVNYINKQTLVIITCPKHGEFEQKPSIHSSGSGCQKCAIESAIGKKKTTTDYFINKAHNVHGDLYDYRYVVYTTPRNKVDIICREHGIFSQIASNHLFGSGCPKCAIHKRAVAHTYTEKEFIDKANKIHKGIYDYSKVNYVRADEKIIIGCKEHGYFKQQAGAHLQGIGCPKCGIIKSTQPKYNNEYFIEKANEVHNGKYDYSDIDYKRPSDKIKINCKEHGSFLQLPHNHLSGRGCPKCGNIKIGNSNSHTQEEFIDRVVEKHGYIFDFSKLNYINSNIAVEVVCKKHGSFSVLPKHLLHNQTCPTCTKERQAQKGWSLSSWKKASEESKDFKAFECYIIEIKSDKEVFYKIGRTFVGTKKRFRHLYRHGYTYRVINSFIGSAEEIFNKETELKRLNNQWKYKPITPFAGSKTECFSKIKLT